MRYPHGGVQRHGTSQRTALSQSFSHIQVAAARRHVCSNTFAATMRTCVSGSTTLLCSSMCLQRRAFLSGAKHPLWSAHSPRALTHASRTYLRLAPTQVLLDRPMEALAALAACTAWHGGELMERVNTRAAACSPASTRAPHTQSTHTASRTNTQPGPRSEAGSGPGGSCAVPQPWADGLPGPVTRTWHRALALARAVEVLRAKRLEVPDLLLVREVYRTEQMLSETVQELAQLQQAWAGGVLGSETARDAVLQRVRAVVRQLDELGLLQDPVVHGADVVPYGPVGATCASLAARVERLRGQLGRETEAASAESGLDLRARVNELDISLRMCKSRTDAVEQTREMLEAAAKVDRLPELGSRMQACRRALLRWRRQGYTPQNAEELCEWAAKLAPALQDEHPGTWGAAVMRLQGALQGAEEGRQRRGARGDKPEVLWVSALSYIVSSGLSTGGVSVPSRQGHGSGRGQGLVCCMALCYSSMDGPSWVIVVSFSEARCCALAR